MKSLLIVFTFFLLLSSNSISKVWEVPGDCPTIQAALDSCSVGDTVLVASGTYFENIEWPNTQNISLLSEFGADSTVIDGNKSGSVITIKTGIDTTTLIVGFTIWNGLAGGGFELLGGGGIYCEDSSPTLVNCLIKENLAAGLQTGGGGIYCKNSSPSLLNCTIEDNLVSGYYYGCGGGIYCENSSPILTNVSIINNSLIGVEKSGAGIYIVSNCSPVFTNVTISDNYCSNFGRGGGLTILNSETSFYNVTLSNNKSDFGGGIFSDSSVMNLMNVLIEENTSVNKGGGIYCTNSEIEINDCNIVGNESKGPTDSDGGGIACFSSDLNLSNITIRDNCTNNFGGGIYLGGNSDVHFDSSNSCSVYLNHAGLLGNDMYSDCTTIVDVILDTFTVLSPDNYFASPIENFNFDIMNQKIIQIAENLYVSPEGSDNNSGLSINEPLKTISRALSKIIADSTNPRIVFLDEGIFSPFQTGELFPLNMKSFISLEGIGTSLSILDGCEMSGVISLYYDYDVRVSNLSLKNGRTADGGGIYLKSSKLTLNNILISDNSASTGGGIYCQESDPVLINTILTKNESTAFGVSGGALFCESSNPELINSICWGNSPNEIEFSGANDPSSIAISYSDILGSVQGIVTNNNGTVNWLEGNLEIDPMFRDTTNGDYHLMALYCGDPYNSPCIDAGNPLIPDKILDCSWGLGAERSDMGAYGGGDSIYVGIDNGEEEIPQNFSLSQNYPNPFNPTTKISWQTPKGGLQTLKVYDVLGREVATLVNEYKPAGKYEIEFNASSLPSGIYIYRLKAGNYIQTKKMILLK